MLSFRLMNPRRMGQAGMTLLELLIGLVLFAIVSLAVAAVLTLGLNLSGFFFRNASTMEAVSDGMFQLTAIMPQVVKIKSCNCSGSGSTLADCTWSPTNEWLDPVIDGGVGSVGTSTQIFEGEFEAGFGGLGAMVDTTVTAYLTGTFPLARGCGNSTYIDDAVERGCRQLVRLSYTTPTLENIGGGVPSKPGSLEISVHSVAAPAQKTTFRIGNESGSVATARSGIVGISCGLASPGAGQVGTNFVLNLRTKVKQLSVERPAAPEYESWYPSGKNYNKGYFREARMKFNFQNLSVRGAYHWRLQSVRGCKKSGSGVVSSSASSEVCCSGAKSGSDCLASCVAAGQAASYDSECCSEKLSGGVCI